MQRTGKKILIGTLAIMSFMYIVFSLNCNTFKSPPLSGFVGTYILQEESQTEGSFAYIVRHTMITVPHIENNPNHYYYYEDFMNNSENSIYRGTFTKISENEYLLSGRDEFDRNKITIDKKGNIIFEKSGDFYKKSSDAFSITPPLKPLIENDINLKNEESLVYEPSLED